MGQDLNGWTAERLDDMAEDVAWIKRTLNKMQSDEVQNLRARVKDLEGRSRAILLGVGGPVVAVLVTVLVEHIH